VSARYLSCGDTAFSVEFGNEISPLINGQVMGLHAAIGAATAEGDLRGVVETVPSYRALMVIYDPLVTSRAELQPRIDALVGGGLTAASTTRRVTVRLVVGMSGARSPRSLKSKARAGIGHPVVGAGGRRGWLEARNAHGPASAPPGHPARGRSIGHGRSPGSRVAATVGPSRRFCASGTNDSRSPLTVAGAAPASSLPTTGFPLGPKHPLDMGI